MAACGGGGKSQATASASPQTSPQAASAASPAASSAAAAPSPSASPAVPTQAVSFTDISGDFGEQAIKDEAALGIFDSASGQFKPNASITRAQYVTWLVRANNIYEKDTASKLIRLAQSGPAQFSDVPVSDPNFKYIQGLANAGYVIGVDKTHFAPNRLLTREEMLAIKAPLDEGSDIKPSGTEEFDLKGRFSDYSQINPRYYAAIDEDRSVRTTQNVVRVWGSIKALQPKKAVTRSEAAIDISEIDDSSAAVALGRTPPPPPK
jgi:hypothetical protein